jgi:replicative DNA helicase
MIESPIQQQILRRAIESPIFSNEVLTKTPLTIFDGNDVYKEISNIVKRHYQTNSSVLAEGTLLTLVEDKLDRMRKDAETQQKYFNVVHEIYNVPDQSNDNILDEKIEKYVRKHMLLELLKKAAVNLENSETLEKISDEWREIMIFDISGKQQEIINVIDDTEYKRRALSTLNINTLSTGFSSIDRLNGGGLAKGELGIILAVSGSGKTMFLTNLATNYVKLKQNVLFIALEELENRMILKFEQAMLQRNKSDILTGTALNEINFNKYQDFYKKKRDMFGNLFFARFSPRKITPAKIEQLISDAQLRTGVSIDAVIIDYPDLLRNPNATGNEAEDGGKLMEEMRRIAQDYNVVMWTASQMNRSAYSAEIRTSEHIEGSLRKRNAAELVLAVNQTPEEYAAGYVRLYADKVRNPPEGGFDKMLGFKVIGSAQTVREYMNDAERQEHQFALEAASDRIDAMFKGKRKHKEKTDMPDYGAEINAALQQNKGA